jgi:hypothetical protein
MHVGCSQCIDFWSFNIWFNWSNKIWFWHTQHYLIFFVEIIHLCLLSSLLHKKIQVGFIVQEKMFCLKTKAQYKLSIVSLQTCYSFKIYNHTIFEYLSFEITLSKCFHILNFFHIPKCVLFKWNKNGKY